MEDDTTFYDRDRKRRVTIRRLDSGAYTFEEEMFGDDPMEMSWFPLTGGCSFSICDTYDTALREARGRISWLADVMDAEPT